jgi:hypothetical protein
MTLPQLVGLLREAPSAEQREWAANGLGAWDGWTNPQAVQALIGAARCDSSPAVRAACVRSLGRMNVGTLPVVSAVQALKGDSDPRVRHEADQAMLHLGGADPGAAGLPR